jgi:hypothetical protein
MDFFSEGREGDMQVGVVNSIQYSSEQKANDKVDSTVYLTGRKFGRITKKELNKNASNCTNINLRGRKIVKEVVALIWGKNIDT